MLYFLAVDKLQQALSIEIRNRRTQLQGVTQDELSQRSGVSRATIANIERGRQAVTIGTLYKLSRGLDMDAGTILNRAADKAYPDAAKSVLLSDVDNKPEVLDTLKKYV